MRFDMWTMRILTLVWLAGMGYYIYEEHRAESPQPVLCPCSERKESNRDETLHEQIIEQMREGMKSL